MSGTAAPHELAHLALLLRDLHRRARARPRRPASRVARHARAPGARLDGRLDRSSRCRSPASSTASTSITGSAGALAADAPGGTEAAIQFVTGYLLEWSLSVDNIFVIAVIFTFMKIPPQYPVPRAVLGHRRRDRAARRDDRDGRGADPCLRLDLLRVRRDPAVLRRAHAAQRGGAVRSGQERARAPGAARLSGHRQAGRRALLHRASTARAPRRRCS